MHILITGSSGFLGQHAVRHFKQLGHNVTGIDLVPSSTTDIVTDVRQYVSQSTCRFQLLLHFAAMVGGRENIEINYLHIMENVELDRVVFEWAIRHVDHLIYPSSCAVYPVDYQTEKNYPLFENMINFERNIIGVSDHLYGWSKLSAERMLWQIHLTTHLQIHVLRPFSGYGPGQSLDYPMANLINMIKFAPDNLQVWGTGEQTRDWVHVEDIMRVIKWCANDATKYCTLNVGSGVPVTFNELIAKIYNMIYKVSCPPIKILPHKPCGVLHRTADVQMLTTFDILPKIDLKTGIKTLL
jgi:nucleoside-diphosphate-sugar epimerase